MKMPAKIAFKKAQKLADEIFGKDKKFLKKATIDSHLILGAKNMFIFFATYHLQKYGEANLTTLSQAIKKNYYFELTGEFWQECQKMDEDTGELLRNTDTNEFLVFLKQISNDEDIDIYIRNQARLYHNFNCYREFACIVFIYDNYMKKFQKKSLKRSI